MSKESHETGKNVFEIEYPKGDTKSNQAGDATTMQAIRKDPAVQHGSSPIIKNRNLDTWTQYFDGQPAPSVSNIIDTTVSNAKQNMAMSSGWEKRGLVVILAASARVSNFL